MLKSATPRDAVAELEAHPVLRGGAADRFTGYGVFGLYFPSGDVLALRRFAATSVGPGYTSVWHRDRTGRWVFYQDTLPHQGCTKYFAAGIDAAMVAPVRVVWGDAYSFSVIVAYGRGMEWRVELAAGGTARALGALVGLMPPPLWRSRSAVRALGAVCGAALRAGRLRLEGTTPSAYRFVSQPLDLWQVAASRAVIGGRDSGESLAPAAQARLGDFWLPARGLFAVANVEMTPPH